MKEVKSELRTTVEWRDGRCFVVVSVDFLNYRVQWRSVWVLVDSFRRFLAQRPIGDKNSTHINLGISDDQGQSGTVSIASVPPWMCSTITPLWDYTPSFIRIYWSVSYLGILIMPNWILCSNGPKTRHRMRRQVYKVRFKSRWPASR